MCRRLGESVARQSLSHRGGKSQLQGWGRAAGSATWTSLQVLLGLRVDSCAACEPRPQPIGARSVPRNPRGCAAREPDSPVCF